MAFRKAFASLGRKKGKEIQAQLGATLFDDETKNDTQQKNLPNQSRDSRGRKYFSFGRQTGKVVAEELNIHFSKDGASDLFAAYVETDDILESKLRPKTSTLMHDVGFFVHSASRLHKDTFLPMFTYSPKTVTEENMFGLGSSRLQECVKKISKGYIRGVLLEEMPLYILETDFLDACACAKILQSKQPMEQIVIAVVDLTKLKDFKLLVSASHMMKMLRLSEAAELEDKVLVWAEDWVVKTAGASETIRPLRDAVLSLIDWRRVETSANVTMPRQAASMDEAKQIRTGITYQENDEPNGEGLLEEDLQNLACLSEEGSVHRVDSVIKRQVFEQSGTDSFPQKAFHGMDTSFENGFGGEARRQTLLCEDEVAMPPRFLFRQKHLSAGSRETPSRLGHSLPGAYM